MCFGGERRLGVRLRHPRGLMEVSVFEERGKSEYPEKNLLEQGREPTTISTHKWRRRRDLNPDYIGGRQVLSPLRHPCSPKSYWFYRSHMCYRSQLIWELLHPLAHQSQHGQPISWAMLGAIESVACSLKVTLSWICLLRFYRFVFRYSIFRVTTYVDCRSWLLQLMWNLVSFLSDSTAKKQQINLNRRRENLKGLKATLFIAARQIVVLN